MPLLVDAKLERTRVSRNFHDSYFLGYRICDSTIIYEKVSIAEYEFGCKKLDECEEN